MERGAYSKKFTVTSFQLPVGKNEELNKKVASYQFTVASSEKPEYGELIF